MMRSTIGAEELVTKVRAVGQYYGFQPFTVLSEKARGAPKVKIPDGDPLAGLSLDPTAEVVASFLRQLRGIDVAPNPRQPLFLWHTNIAHGRPAPKKATIQFHALGADRALADAVVIRALLALTRDLFHAEPTLRVNSMGDKETRARYARELASYFKKRGATLPEDCVARAKQDTLAAAELAIAREYADDLPSPTEHLSDASRKRFEDLLEYLEMTDTPYELARHLISHGGIWSDTCFEVLVHGERVAWGSRYSDLARRYFPSSFPAVGAVISIGSEGAVVKKPSTSKLRFTFIHIGDEAKRLSIKLAEDFRKAHVPLTQHIGVESLTEQMLLAEQRNSPYLLIMGRREALENSAILRNRATQQEVILPLLGIAERLKAVA
jgi:histidyl-tRNA synthetase